MRHGRPIEWRGGLSPVSSPYARNARTHSPEQVEQLCASIREWGWTMPVLVDESGGIIAGHGRVLAAQKLGLAEVPVMVAVGWSEAQRRAYVIADNKLALNAGWDGAVLALELKDLAGLGFDLGLSGFSALEFAGLTASRGGLTDPDHVPEPPAVPASELGDVWLLGRHRITCGSSTEAAVVARVLAGAKPHLMVTDPPYGVNYDPAWRQRAGIASGKGVATGKVLNDDRADWRAAWALFAGDVAYVWHGERQMVDMALQLHDAGFEIRNLIVWAKGHLVMGRGHYHPQHETCWYAVRKNSTGHWHGDCKQTTLWAIEKPRNSETGHSTQKPVECMRRPIENNSRAGDAIYEPFSGSGTTLIAAEMTGRTCFAIELNPTYVDVAVRRWQEFTGQQAVLEGDGRGFDAVAMERLAAT